MLRKKAKKMRIKKITYQARRDFKAVFECEHCEHTLEKWGYDDENFHNQVIPTMKCPNCAQTTDPKTYQPRSTKYPPHMTV